MEAVPASLVDKVAHPKRDEEDVNEASAFFPADARGASAHRPCRNLVRRN